MSDATIAIADLEAEIERLSEAAERCRKTIPENVGTQRIDCIFVIVPHLRDDLSDTVVGVHGPSLISPHRIHFSSPRAARGTTRHRPRPTVALPPN